MTRGARAVVFDMDGVLVDSGAHHRDAWRATFRDLGLTPPAEFWRITIGRPADEAVALLVDGVDRAEARRLAEMKRQHYTRRDLERVLDALGLRPRFDVVVTADDVRWGKPHPEVYLKAAAGLGVDPSACVVFEDAVVGVQSARAAGMRVIGVTSAHTSEELVSAGAERAVADFEDVRWPV